MDDTLEYITVSSLYVGRLSRTSLRHEKDFSGGAARFEVAMGIRRRCEGKRFANVHIEFAGFDPAEEIAGTPGDIGPPCNIMGETRTGKRE